MLLAIAIIVVVVLLAVALLPVKKREPEQLKQASPVAFLTPEPAQPVRQTTLRQQQLDEEANSPISGQSSVKRLFRVTAHDERPTGPDSNTVSP